MAIDYRDVAKKIIEYAASLVEEEFGADTDASFRFERNHAMQSALGLAWLNNIRETWERTVESHPVLKKRMAIAKVLMEENGYEVDFVVGMPGQEAAVCTIDGRKAVCFDYTMGGMTIMPISSIFANKASEILDAADKVNAAAQATAHHGDVWPIHTAGGETFNSAEEMAQSKNPHVRRFIESFQGRP